MSFGSGPGSRTDGESNDAHQGRGGFILGVRMGMYGMLLRTLMLLGELCVVSIGGCVNELGECDNGIGEVMGSNSLRFNRISAYRTKCVL